MSLTVGCHLAHARQVTKALVFQSMKILRIYFSLNGRLSITHYWLYWVIPIACILLAEHYFEYSFDTNVIRVFNIIVLWPFIATSVKRLHDLNRSGWWLLLNLIPLIGNIMVGFLLTFIPGTKGQNEYDVI